MSDYATDYDSARDAIVIDRLVAKGKDVLELCLERGKNLCLKGFIDCQIEKGGVYVQVVEAMMDHVAVEMVHTEDKRRHALLLDLQHYAAEQLRLVRSKVGDAVERE